MKQSTRAGLIACLFALASSVMCCSTYADDTTSSKLTDIEIMFGNPVAGKAELSPDGNKVAMLIAVRGDRIKLAVMDLATNDLKVIAGSKIADISDFHWLNSSRILYSVSGSNSISLIAPGLISIDADGNNQAILVSPQRRFGTSLSTTFSEFFDVDNSGTSDSFFATRPIISNTWEIKGNYLGKIDSHTGERTPVPRPGDVLQWVIDQHGVPRIAVILDNNVLRVFHRRTSTDEWQKIWESNSSDPNMIEPCCFAGDNDFYVFARNGRDTLAFYRFDLERNKLDDQPIVASAEYDLMVAPLIDGTTKHLLGVRYATDAFSTVWFDARLKEIQQDVDKMLPGTINDLLPARGGSLHRILVRTQSDVVPPTYVVYDAQTKKLRGLGKPYPELDLKSMAHQDMVRYPARDGRSIPAYLTIPKGTEGQPHPLVLVVHGEPGSRGAVWGWDPKVQFLASRGYAVLQPEFRGGTGFGFDHYRAGWKQWGLAMEDDLADGVMWAIKNGYADPKRVCIFGGSYGGYAALMGLAKYPGMFKCAVDVAGVTDLSLMYKAEWWSDVSDEARAYDLPLRVGDPKTDAKMLHDNSPLNLVEQIHQPILVVHGVDDLRVPVKHARRFYDAIREHNKDVQLVEYEDEGHTLSSVKDVIDFWRRVDKFLAKHLAPTQLPAAVPSGSK